VNAPVAGATYNWYSSSCSGLLGQGLSYSCTNCTSAGTYTYYVSVTTPGCNESSCTAVTVTITTAPTSETWLGAVGGSNNWFNTSNWSAGCLPACNTNVTIPSTANNPDIGISSGTPALPAACSSITINSGATLSFSDNKGELDICGDLIIAGTLTTNSKGTIVFMGTTAQTFSVTGTITNDFYNVVLNNTATLPLLTVKTGPSASNYKDLVVASGGSFSFLNGIVVTEGIRKLIIKNTSPSALSGYSTNGYVYGRVVRYVVSGSAYDFPVGGNPSGATVYPYELMNLNFSSINGGLTNITATYDNPNNTTGTNMTGNGLPLTEQGSQYTTLVDNGGANTGTGTGTIGGIWTVTPDAGSAVYAMTLYGRNFMSASYPAGNYYSVVKRNTYSMCGTVPSWTLDGTILSAGNASNVITAGRTGMSGFSQFAIAKHVNPLPVELITFDAVCFEHSVKLSWATATEMNNNFFTIERSCDGGNNFTALANIPGAGNSTVIKQYSLTDYDFPGGTCYYRLSQTDFNGKKTVFSPIAANCNLNSGFNLVSILPNPADDEMNVLFTIDSNDKVYLYITDMLGQQLFEKNIKPDIGLNKIELDVRDFAAGIYFVKLSNGTKTFMKKIIKK
jgi:hypothetical protein